MTNQVHSALSGTMTEQNLHTALADKSVSSVKYRLFADKARENGNEALALLLEGVAGNDYRHAELIAEYLGLISSDENNLLSLMASEEYDSTVTYPEYSDTAVKEGFGEIAQKMQAIATADKYHHATLTDAHSTLTGHADTPLRCPVCGYTVNTPEDRCPLCSRPSKYFLPVR